MVLDKAMNPFISRKIQVQGPLQESDHFSSWTWRTLPTGFKNGFKRYKNANGAWIKSSIGLKDFKNVWHVPLGQKFCFLFTGQVLRDFSPLIKGNSETCVPNEK